MTDESELIVVHDRRDLRRLLAGKRHVGLVQTRGSFHDGHLAVIREARRQSETVVVSIYADELGTGRDVESDLVSVQDQALAEGAGADIIFAPSVDVFYPFGRPQITIGTGPIGEKYEGARADSNFGTRLNQIAKMFNIVQPDQAFFGQRDAQLLALVRQLIRDLDFNVQVEAVPVNRDLDGLATAHKNALLSETDREQAAQISSALYAGVQEAADSGSAERVLQVCQDRLAQYPALQVEYLDLVDPMSFRPWPGNNASTALLIIAVKVGEQRLIDNQLVVLGNRF